jgi:hypothetical protein
MNIEARPNSLYTGCGLPFGFGVIGFFRRWIRWRNSIPSAVAMLLANACLVNRAEFTNRFAIYLVADTNYANC